MTHSTLTVEIVGVAPLVTHNGQLADPLNPIARELERYTSRRRKTVADHHRIAELEYLGGLWLQDGRPCIPAAAFEAAICQSAARRRARSLYRGAIMVKTDAEIRYDGPDTAEGLVKDPTFRLRVGVVIKGRRVMRTRPMFPTWAATIEIGYLASFVNPTDLLDVLATAGDTIGVGDYRPRHGRFSVAAASDPVPSQQLRARHP